MNRRSCLENAREHNSLRDSTNDPREGSASQVHEPDANKAIAHPNVERARRVGLFALGQTQAITSRSHQGRQSSPPSR